METLACSTSPPGNKLDKYDLFNNSVISVSQQPHPRHLIREEAILYNHGNNWRMLTK